jgi:5-oxoprolinase (ATP-hydrolysing)
VIFPEDVLLASHIPHFFFNPSRIACYIASMQSDGGLAPVSSFYGFRAILSGPAGGVVVQLLLCVLIALI